MNQMIKQCGIAAAVLILFASADAQPSNAQDQMEPAPMSQMAGVLNPANWRMPQWKMPNFRELMPGGDEKARIKKKKDGLVDEVTKTASNSWNKTKDALNPQRFSPMRFLPASARTPSSSQPQQSKPGFFRSLFAPAPPQREDNGTVTEFLRQSRPSP